MRAMAVKAIESHRSSSDELQIIRNEGEEAE
jgi:hypothetical protein